MYQVGTEVANMYISLNWIVVRTYFEAMKA